MGVGKETLKFVHDPTNYFTRQLVSSQQIKLFYLRDVKANLRLCNLAVRGSQHAQARTETSSMPSTEGV